MWVRIPPELPPVFFQRFFLNRFFLSLFLDFRLESNHHGLPSTLDKGLVDLVHFEVQGTLSNYQAFSSLRPQTKTSFFYLSTPASPTLRSSLVRPACLFRSFEALRSFILYSL